MTLGEQIKDIMENFDFVRVHKVMKFLDWKWTPYNRIPTLHEIKESANNLLNEYGKKVGGGGTGGFMVRTYSDGSIELVFEIASWPW